MSLKDSAVSKAGEKVKDAMIEKHPYMGQVLKTGTYSPTSWSIKGDGGKLSVRCGYEEVELDLKEARSNIKSAKAILQALKQITEELKDILD